MSEFMILLNQLVTVNRKSSFYNSVTCLATLRDNPPTVWLTACHNFHLSLSQTALEWQLAFLVETTSQWNIEDTTKHHDCQWCIMLKYPLPHPLLSFSIFFFSLHSCHSRICVVICSKVTHLQCTMLNYSVHHLDMFNKLLMTSQHYIILLKNKCHISTIPVDTHKTKKVIYFFFVKPQGNETSVVTIWCSHMAQSTILHVKNNTTSTQRVMPKQEWSRCDILYSQYGQVLWHDCCRRKRKVDF